MTPSSGALGAALATGAPGDRDRARRAARSCSDATEAHGLRGTPTRSRCRAARRRSRRCSRGATSTTSRSPRAAAARASPAERSRCEGGVVLDLRHMNRVRSLDPALWRAEVEAGVRTAEVHRRARENGLLFPPDPGAAEQSQIGGNIATNAGGPHTFKYGATGAWVTGLEVVLAPGEVVRLGGAVRKDVAGYDLQSLLDRLRGHARDRHRRVAAADPGARARLPGARAVSRRASGHGGGAGDPRSGDRSVRDRVPRQRDDGARRRGLPGGGRTAQGMRQGRSRCWPRSTATSRRHYAPAASCSRRWATRGRPTRRARRSRSGRCGAGARGSPTRCRRSGAGS